MRMSVSYGLERFCGEHLRLRNEAAGSYWKDVWNALVDDILKPAQITIPNEPVNIQDPPRGARSEEKKRLEEENTRKIRSMADGLWRFSEEHPDDQRVALAVLTQLCDCLVWWTQRYKSK